jgi:hypothetical protein
MKNLITKTLVAIYVAIILIGIVCILYKLLTENIHYSYGY